MIQNFPVSGSKQILLLSLSGPAITTTLNYIAGTYHAQGEGEKAEQFYRDA